MHLTPNYGVAPHNGIYNEPLQMLTYSTCMLRFFICSRPRMSGFRKAQLAVERNLHF
jgi:hypothetical protein